MTYKFTTDADGQLQVTYDIDVTGSGYLKIFGMTGYSFTLYDSSYNFIEQFNVYFDPWGGLCPPTCTIACCRG